MSTPIPVRCITTSFYGKYTRERRAEQEAAYVRSDREVQLATAIKAEHEVLCAKCTPEAACASYQLALLVLNQSI